MLRIAPTLAAEAADYSSICSSIFSFVSGTDGLKCSPKSTITPSSCFPHIFNLLTKTALTAS